MSDATKLEALPRDTRGSRSIRRLRRAGRVPGVLYGGDAEPVAFDVDSRELRNALAASGQVLEIAVGSDKQTAVLKDAQIHPVRGETMHVDLLRVRMDVAIHGTCSLELTGGDDAPGVKEGGVLSGPTLELNIEALPADLPESISFDVSGMELNETVYLSALTMPKGVTLLDDLEETVLATITPPSPVEEETDEVETETELVGEDGEPVAAADTGDSEGDGADGDSSSGDDN